MNSLISWSEIDIPDLLLDLKEQTGTLACYYCDSVKLLHLMCRFEIRSEHAATRENHRNRHWILAANMAKYCLSSSAGCSLFRMPCSNYYRV